MLELKIIGHATKVLVQSELPLFLHLNHRIFVGSTDPWKKLSCGNN